MVDTMVIGDPNATVQWQSYNTSRTITSQSSEMDVLDHFQQMINILKTLENTLKEKYEDSKGFYEDDGEEQSLGEMNAYNEAQKIVGQMIYEVGKDMRSRESSLKNYGFTYQPPGHLGYP